MMMKNRPRTLRKTESTRSLVKETSLCATNFLVPLFVVEGRNVKEEIPSMPGYFRQSIDVLEKEIKVLWAMNLRGVLLFVKVPDILKDNAGTEALNPNGLMQRAIKAVKNTCPEMLVMTDVALDPYSSYGHDGVVEHGEILNDRTVALLAEISVSHAKAGADFVAPSDMMDSRVVAIRLALEDAGYTQTGIMSYSAKYASSFYGPFRDALDSAPGFGDKKTYQMDFHNRREAIREALIDVEEGADIIMVKPALAYLDIIREIRDQVLLPVAAYQVSGEYAMLKAAASKGWIDHDAVMLEQLIAIRRAGADLIATYFAKDAVKYLDN